MFNNIDKLEPQMIADLDKKHAAEMASVKN